MRETVRPKQRETFLAYARHGIGQEEIDEVVATLRSDWITTGPKVKRLEQELAASLGASSALAVNSCTAAMHLALVVLGVRPGDQVITSPMTFCSTANVIEHIGATPVLVDVEPDTLNLSPQAVQETLARLADGRPVIGRAGPDVPRGPVRAMMPVHLYGHPCDMDALLPIARQYELAVVEDAAHALAARYKGRPIGAPIAAGNGEGPIPAGMLTCFSFYATKNLTTAEGGAVVGSGDLVDQARALSLHGMTRDAWKRYSAQGSWYYEVVRPGFKYNMTDIQASLGLHQLQRLPQFQARRRAIAQRYNQAFAQVEAVQPPVEHPDVEHAWHVYAIRLRTDRLHFPDTDSSSLAARARFIEELRSRQIGTSVHFIPIHLHPYYRTKYGYEPHDFPVAYQEYTRLISLPLYPMMSDNDVDDVIDAVIDIADRYHR